MIILNVPPAERAAAARLGARLDPVRNTWYVPPGALATLFERWMPKFEILGERSTKRGRAKGKGGAAKRRAGPAKVGVPAGAAPAPGAGRLPWE